MKINRLIKTKYIFLLGILFFKLSSNAGNETGEAKFVVVIDAGHGGHDPGALGKITKEKDINLAVALNLDDLIRQNHKDVKVILTRSNDTYLTLQHRADIANNNHADLFISIHTNRAASPSAYGAETYTVGLAKTKGNLDVAMRENAVITLEDDYKTKYQGFDPKSVDSYIMFEFMQDKYIDRSLNFASMVQNNFKKFNNRSDRGVRQAGFWVLWRTACPSVLVELGFISNPAEECYLASNEGRMEMAKAILTAFEQYKKSHELKSVMHSQNNTPETVKSNNDTAMSSNSIPQTAGTKITSTPKDSTLKKDLTSTENQKTVYKLQILSSPKKISEHSSVFKKTKNISYFTENGTYKYTIGSDSDIKKILQLKKELSEKFPQAFVIAFLGNKKISIQEAKNKN